MKKMLLIIGIALGLPTAALTNDETFDTDRDGWYDASAILSERHAPCGEITGSYKDAPAA